MSSNVLVVGPTPEAQLRVVRALRARNLPAWSDHCHRVAFDFVSFDWADAVVMFDTTAEIESRHLRALSEFTGPRLLCTPTLVPVDERVDLIEHCFDLILPASTSPQLIAAYVDRFLQRAMMGAGHASRVRAID